MQIFYIHHILFALGLAKTAESESHPHQSKRCMRSLEKCCSGFQEYKRDYFNDLDFKCRKGSARNERSNVKQRLNFKQELEELKTQVEEMEEQMKATDAEGKHEHDDLRSEWVMMKRDISQLQTTLTSVATWQDNVTTQLTHLSAAVNTTMHKKGQHNQLVSRKDLKGLLEQVADLTAHLNTMSRSVTELQQTNGNVPTIPTVSHFGGNAVPPRPRRIFPKDCSEVRRDLGKSAHVVSGSYHVWPWGDYSRPLSVFCDMRRDDSWTVIHRRETGLLSFDRSYLEYEVGFGSLFSELWLGLKVMHALTKPDGKPLRVEIEDFEGNFAYAEYSKFSVGGPEKDYTLLVGGYEGTAGDALSYHHGSPFSAKDHDRDRSARNCAQDNGGGFWFDSCLSANPNGRYHQGRYDTRDAIFSDGIVWFPWKKTEYYSLKRLVMMIG